MSDGHSNKLALSVREAAAASGLGRSTIFKLIASHELRSLKAGSRRLVLLADLRAYLERQAEATSGTVEAA